MFIKKGSYGTNTYLTPEKIFLTPENLSCVSFEIQKPVSPSITLTHAKNKIIYPQQG